eukprot:scaffold304382_cov15-Tisochrysis_lutea.AAC.1
MKRVPPGDGDRKEGRNIAFNVSLHAFPEGWIVLLAHQHQCAHAAYREDGHACGRVPFPSTDDATSPIIKIFLESTDACTCTAGFLDTCSRLQLAASSHAPLLKAYISLSTLAVGRLMPAVRRAGFLSILACI